MVCPPLNSEEEHLINNKVLVINMATEIEGIKEVTEAILGIGEVAIDNFTFKVSLLSALFTSYMHIGYS